MMSAAETAVCYKLASVIECRCINQNSFSRAVCSNKCYGGRLTDGVREITQTTAWRKHSIMNKRSLELFMCFRRYFLCSILPGL